MRGTYSTRARGGFGSWRETIATGRVFAASPRSANHTSPGCGLVEQVEDLLFDGAGARKIQDIVVREFDDFRDALSRFGCRPRLPLAHSSVYLSDQRIHEDLLPRFLVYLSDARWRVP